MFKLKKVLLIILAVVLIGTVIIQPVSVNAFVNVPSHIRVGIYFVNAYQNTTLTSFTTSATSGIKVGVTVNGDFKSYYEHYGSNRLSVFMDSPGSKYFVKIGGSYSRNVAASLVSQYKSKGVPAYIVYDNSWQVYAGSFTNLNTANNYANTYASKTGQGANVVTSPVRNIRVTKSNGEIVGLQLSSRGNFQVRPLNEDGIVKINGRGYRGYIEARRYSDSNMTIINIIDFTEYLYGVIPNEIQGLSHPEALKAQAVAARTYTLAQLGKHMKYGFDLCNTDDCQVYRGYDSEYPTTTRAVNETRGQIVTYMGNMASIYYSASSGGMTANSENVWFSKIPYLTAVADKYESPSYKYSNWSYEYTPSEIKDMLINDGYNIGDIVNIEITDVTVSGRAYNMVITGTKGEAVFKKGQTRAALSPSLPSQKFYIQDDAHLPIQLDDQQVVSVDPSMLRIQTSLNANIISNAKVTGLKVTDDSFSIKRLEFSHSPTSYVFVGKGKGHGVGMSQVGAKGMAKAGYSYKDILTHYFQGTKITTLPIP